MSNSIGNSSSTDTTIMTVVDLLENHYSNYEPLVRYAHPRNDRGPAQEPTLRSIHEEIPKGANWVSAIYLVSEGQLERLDKYADNPYANPSSDNIAKTIQDECENDRRVLYSVHAESDEHEDNDDSDVVPLPTMIEWLKEFTQTVVEVDPADCTFYYSGNRSIHVHTPLFVTGENLRWLKEQTKQFCDRTGYVLDTGVYKTKQQFRIPGAAHQSNGGKLQKVQIQTDWDRPEIISAAADDVVQPDTYAEVLQTIFDRQEPDDISELLLSSSATDDEEDSDSVLSTWGSRYLRSHREEKRAYKSPEFYPYPIGEEYDGRSVASIRVIGDPFQRRVAGKNRTFIPSYFYGAHSCSGREYTKDNHYAPLQLSSIDAKKWDYEGGEYLVIIGGGSYESIIHEVDKETAERIGELLDPTDGNRKDALDYLEAKGYHIGSAGSSYSDSTSRHEDPTEQRQGDTNFEKTDAEYYKERAERGDIEQSLKHGERRKVANRLLTVHGWDYAWRWFREQYGNDFNPQRTWTGLRSIIETFSEDFDEIDVPSKPQQ